jgi:hypothetical protein
MAGVKVTDLTPLATAANDDIFYIVDTSSNTSKQIEVQDIYSGMPQFASGTFTPVESNVSNNATVSVYAGTYSRVGDVVTMAFRMDVQMDTAETATVFNLSIPVASNFTSRYHLNGTVTANSEIDTCVIEADFNVTDLILCAIDSINTGDYLENIGVVVQYLIL